MSHSLKDFFYYTKKERKGVLGLLFVIILINLIIIFIPYLVEKPAQDFETTKAAILAFEQGLQERKEAQKRSSNRYSNNWEQSFRSPKGKKKVSVKLKPQKFDPNTVDANTLKKMQLPQNVIKSIVNYRNKGGQFRTKQDFGKIYTLSEEHYQTLLPFVDLPNQTKNQTFHLDTTLKELPPPFEFDPNTASAEDFQRLGLADNTVKSILNYRNKGGQFRKREDFKKIYTLPEATYEHLAAAIQIKPAAPNKKRWDIKPLYAIDINQASLEDFQQFKGIGPSFAKRILKYKLQLGGFVHINQVAEVYGLADSTYNKMKPYLSCLNTSPDQININTADLEQLKSHPYLRWFHAKDIIAYREQEGNFKSVELLQILEAFDDNKGTYQRIKPYLKVE